MTLDQSPDAVAKPTVTAGFKCAALLPQAAAVNMPAMTANAQPAVITIQPPPAALDLFRTTFATTPFPSRIKTSVPKNSPSIGETIGLVCVLGKGVDPVERARHGFFPIPIQSFARRLIHFGCPGLVRQPVFTEIINVLVKPDGKTRRVCRAK